MITYLCRSALAAVAALGVGAALAEAAIRVEAYRGEPFGVGRVTVDLPQDDAPSADDRFGISEANDRVLYPALERRRQLGRIVRRFINIELPNRATFYFMFRGDGPLELRMPRPHGLDAAVDLAQRHAALEEPAQATHRHEIAELESQGRAADARAEVAKARRREAELRRQEHAARQAHHEARGHQVPVRPFQRRLVAVAVALVTVLGIVVLM